MTKIIVGIKNKPDKSKNFTPKACCDSELSNFEDIEDGEEKQIMRSKIGYIHVLRVIEIF